MDGLGLSITRAFPSAAPLCVRQKSPQPFLLLARPPPGAAGSGVALLGIKVFPTLKSVLGGVSLPEQQGVLAVQGGLAHPLSPCSPELLPCS